MSKFADIEAKWLQWCCSNIMVISGDLACLFKYYDRDLKKLVFANKVQLDFDSEIKVHKKEFVKHSCEFFENLFEDKIKSFTKTPDSNVFVNFFDHESVCINADFSPWLDSYKIEKIGCEWSYL